MMQKFRKTRPSVIQMNNRTAFLASLSLNIFFVFMQFIVLMYGYYMGEDIRGIVSGRILRLTNHMPPVIMFLVNISMVYIFFRIEFWGLKKFSDNRRKLYLSFLVLFIFMAVLSTLVSQLLGIWFKGELTAYRYSIIHFAKDLMFLISSIFFSTQIYLIIKNQKKIEENKNLTIENFKNRYNALKNQTDPHFLFNSLNSLNGLIGYDNELAHEYVMQLSSVFRYTMQEHSVVSLSDELEFTRSYIYLMKIRYADALLVDIQIPDIYPEHGILPVSIQTLVENAIKHNIISRQKPLNLVIKLTDEKTIVVENNYQPRKDAATGNGVGLSNLNERYWLMFRKNINIDVDDDIFRVEIPLIKKTRQVE